MTLHIDLSPEFEVFMKGEVARGFYGNATEVIRDAPRRMQAEEFRMQAWQAAIRKGDDELARGEGNPYSAETLKNIAETAFGDMHSGKPIDPYVFP